MYGDRDALRAQYVEAWRKHTDGDPLTPLQAQLADVIAAHPEYHALLINPDAATEAEFTVEAGQTNPFLHMGLHLAIRDQVSLDRPPGIRETFRTLAHRLGDALEAEHRCMECLGQALWAAQRGSGNVDEQAYLDCIKRL